MNKLIIFFLSLGFHNLCSQSFQGQSYLLTDNLLDECNVESRCDCCVSDLIFVSEKQFVLVEYCIDKGNYYTGTYLLTNGKLLLEFKQIEVNESFDYERNQLTEKKVQYKFKSIEFQVSSCKEGGLILENPNETRFQYGTRQPKEDEVKTITKIRKSKPFKILIN